MTTRRACSPRFKGRPPWRLSADAEPVGRLAPRKEDPEPASRFRPATIVGTLAVAAATWAIKRLSSRD